MLGICIFLPDLGWLGSWGTALPACGTGVVSVCGDLQRPRSQVPECSAGAAVQVVRAGALVVESERGRGRCGS